MEGISGNVSRLPAELRGEILTRLDLSEVPVSRGTFDEEAMIDRAIERVKEDPGRLVEWSAAGLHDLILRILDAAGPTIGIDDDILEGILTRAHPMTPQGFYDEIVARISDDRLIGMLEELPLPELLAALWNELNLRQFGNPADYPSNITRLAAVISAWGGTNADVVAHLKGILSDRLSFRTVTMVIQRMYMAALYNGRLTVASLIGQPHLVDRQVISEYLLARGKVESLWYILRGSTNSLDHEALIRPAVVSGESASIDFVMGLRNDPRWIHTVYREIIRQRDELLLNETLDRWPIDDLGE